MRCAFVSASARSSNRRTAGGFRAKPSRAEGSSEATTAGFGREVADFPGGVGLACGFARPGQSPANTSAAQQKEGESYLHYLWSRAIFYGRLLRFIVRMAESGRLLVLLTYRSDEVPRGHVLRSWLPELERTRRVTRWELSRLGDEQVAELVEELLGRVPDDGSLERVTELSEGVPFFVEELVGIDGLRSGDDLPETLRELVLAVQLRGHALLA